MANRQKIAPMGLAGVMAQRGLQTTLTVPGKRFVAGNGGLETAGLLVDAGKKMAEERLETEKQRQAMEAAASLRASRQAMEAAETPEQLREIATTAEKSLPAQFGSENSGKAFWQEHGDKILEANRADTAKIAAMKQADFGRNSLRSMLADNQNLLAETAEPVQAEKLLEMGTGEIERTPFLTPEDKQFYRDGYLKTGILNLALNSPETAEAAADRYFPGDSDGIKARIAETRRLNEEGAKRQQERERQRSYLAAYGDAQSLWQKRERGEISPAQYYVLSADTNPEMLWGDGEDRSPAPLADAYRLVRKMNEGESLSAEEVRDAGNSLISAYRHSELGLEETAALQNQLVAAQQGGNASELIFDRAVDELADRAFMRDIPAGAEQYTPYGRELMEHKAKLAFDIYQNYYGRKTALAEEFTAQGGQMTPAAAKKIGRQALAETAAELNLKETPGDAPSFGELRRTLKSSYSGSGERRIWERFAKEAPYAEDKTAVMRRIATEEQKRELSYPQFETYDEVMQAGLAPGDRFYFKGRLAVMKG